MGVRRVHVSQPLASQGVRDVRHATPEGVRESTLASASASAIVIASAFAFAVVVASAFAFVVAIVVAFAIASLGFGV